MKKKILSIALALVMALTLVPAATAAETTPGFIDGVTVEVPGIPGMKLVLPSVFDRYLFRESDGAVIFALNYQAYDDDLNPIPPLIFDRDITLSPLPVYFDEEADAAIYGLVPISAKAGVPVKYGWLNHSFTIDGVTVCFYQPSGEPTVVFWGGEFMGEHYGGLLQKFNDFEIRPISGIAVGAAA